jgi:acyl transferase domain-containing protein
MSGSEEFDYQIAVIGMAGRFPGASDVDKFWENLRDGVEAITRFSDDELQASGASANLLDDPNYVKAGAILEDVESFDAAFFGFNPREAEIMDPQHRILLEQAWAAVEAAGYDPDSYEGRVGVYAGVSSNTYLINNLLSNPRLLESVGPFQTAIGNDRDFLATQVAYKLNLKGPSFTVQTACSTSLVAIHLACQSLLNRECDMALAGGVSIRVPQKQGYLYEQGGILSPDGHCRAFDAQAQGTLSGNGAGVVVLKRLADALSDGDTIHAIIKGSAANNDGSLKVGYTAPSVEGQSAVIEEALSMAMVEPETITYVEAHGTATPLGDPVEIAALTEAFRKSTGKKGFCAVGSVKTNIGHLDAAAGVASFIKTVLALKHRMLPPSLHYNTPNPRIDFASSPFYVNGRLSTWEAGATPRRAGVSSFGIGGTNAHVVVEEAPTLSPAESSRSHHLIVLSAKTGQALEAATANLAARLKEDAGINLGDLAYTLQAGRRHFSHRRAFVCSSVDDAVNALEALSPATVFTGYQEQVKRSVAFTFSGQGTQYAGMARGLYESEPAFRAQVDLCSEILNPLLGFDLRGALYPAKEEAEQAALRLSQTIAAQPALFVIEYALAKLLEQWGIVAIAMCGHSIGEYVAACLAGVFSLDDALSLVATRGRLMQQLPRGAMLAVPLAATDIQPLLDADKALSLAAINAPSLCVISGPEDSVKRVHDRINEDGETCRYLETSHAFHSAMMDPILEAFTERVKRIKLHPPAVPYISNLTGTWITEAEATSPDYWAKHLRQTVHFSDGIRTLLDRAGMVLLEVGPGHTTGAALKQYQGAERVALSTLRRPRDTQSDVAFLLNTVGRLWLEGVPVDWAGLHQGERRRRIPLPTYPFERQRYWIEPRQQESDHSSPDKYERPDMADWFYVPSWKRSIPPTCPAGEEQTGDLTCWLVFDDGSSGLGLEVIEKLERRGAFVIKASAGNGFARTAERAFTLNPRSDQDYKELLRQIRALDRVLEKILHLWNVTSSDSAAAGGDTFEDSQYRGFYSLIFLAQALGDQYLSDHVEIGVVSTNLQEVTGEEALRPEKATLLGPSKVIPLEYSNIACRSIDITFTQSAAQPPGKLAETVIAEMLQKSSDPVVAYRGKHRWVQVFEPLRLDEEAQRPARLRRGGVYVLTGGLGELELELARYLAEQVQARLVLIDNADFPERAYWQHLLETGEENPTATTIKRLLALEELGAQLIVAKSDITSPEQAQGLVGRALQAFGAIHGVIHTATVVGGGMIQFKKPDMAESVLAPKVKATLALDGALADVPLDFIALFSSALSITGVFGQADYCGANAFISAFARSSFSRRGGLTVSIAWNIPEWEDWQGAAMLAVPEIQAEFNRARQLYGINYSEGVKAFARVINHTQPEVIVAAQNFQALVEEQSSSAASGLLNMLENAGSAEHKPARPEIGAAYAAPTNETERLTADIWQDIFGVERVGIHDDFFSLGGNSLLAIQLVSRLRKTFKVEIPLSKLFESPTVAGLSASIVESQVRQKDLEEMERLLKEIEAMPPESVQVELEAIQSSKEEKVNG